MSAPPSTCCSTSGCSPRWSSRSRCPAFTRTGSTARSASNHGLVAPAAIVAVIVLLVTLGLRDKVLFIAARSEQYLPALIFMAFFPFVDMIVAAKLLIVVVWFCAGFSKCNRHFPNVLGPMVSNVPWLPSKKVKRMHYANFPEDLRPSKLTYRIAHGPGMFGELVPPLVLLFSHNHYVTLAAAVFMIGYHLFIISTFPLAVPLEWNVLFMYLTAFLFLGYPNQHGYGLGDMSTPLLVVTAAGLLFFPVLGNLRPDLVSFLPSMRQYAGNWASAMWAFAPGAEQKLNEHIVKAAPMQKDQLQIKAPLLGYDERVAEILLNMLLAWRSMHSQARGLNSVMIDAPGRGHRHLHAARGGVQLQRDRRVQLRRRAPARPVPDRRDPEALPVRARRVHRRLGRVRAGVARPPAVLGHGRRRRRGRARQLGGEGRRQGDPVAAERPDPRPGRLAARRIRARQPLGADAPLASVTAPQLAPVAGSGGDGMTSAIVVGSGPNGLAAALTLASEGIEVTVLEAADTLGGGTRTSELTLPGLLHDECSAAHPLAVDTPFTRRFDLSAHGLTLALAGGSVRAPARRRRRRRRLPVGARRPQTGSGMTAGAGNRCSDRSPSASTTSPPTSCDRCCTCPSTRSS